jgi:hypothetical protein
MTNLRLRARLWASAMTALLPCAAPVAAQQAVVTTQDASALEIGQAFLAHHGGQCYAILPTHVVREAGRPALRREGTQGLLGEAIDHADLGEDLSLARLDGAITSDCGASALSVRRAIERLLQQGRLGTLRSINGDGTVAQLGVTIVDDDGRGMLRVQPTHQGNPIRKGLSGSLLLIDGVSVGMLLSVNARSGIGTVARIDTLMAKVDAHLINAAAPTTAPPAQAGAAPSSAPAAAPAGGPRVLAWSALPIDEAHRAANLTASAEAPPWASLPTRWPVTIDLQAGEGLVTINGVVLDGRGVADAGQLPAHVEVFINPSGDARGWRAITATTVDYRDGVAHIALAPMRTRLLRLSFSATVGGGERISLGRIGLLQ